MQRENAYHVLEIDAEGFAQHPTTDPLERILDVHKGHRRHPLVALQTVREGKNDRGHMY